MKKYRRYPRAYDLEKIKFWLRLLYSVPIPLVEITTRKLKERLRNGDVDQGTFDEIIDWKRAKNIELSDESEYRYLLRDLGIITNRKLDPDVEIYLPLGGDGPVLSTFIETGSKTKMYYLTPLGMKLCETLLRANRPLYENILFWLVLRNKVYQPVIQQVVSSPDSYTNSPVESLIHLGDSVSLNCVLSWGCFFGIFGLGKNGHMFLVEPFSRRILITSILEVNWFLQSKHLINKDVLVREMVNALSNGLSIPSTAVDFATLLEVLFLKGQGTINGYPSSRGEMSLPNKDRIQMLRFKEEIPLKSVKKVRPSELLSFLPYAEVTVRG